ncbi:MAG TPA: hypothetical protein VFS20_08865 [Longimicrobium sp.]|nr:hypothetical protein [Longimicrobium sp.]
MTNQVRKKPDVRWFLAMVAGLCYSAIGITITGDRSTRFVLVGVGMFLLLLGLAGMMAQKK